MLRRIDGLSSRLVKSQGGTRGLRRRLQLFNNETNRSNGNQRAVVVVGFLLVFSLAADPAAVGTKNQKRTPERICKERYAAVRLEQFAVHNQCSASWGSRARTHGSVVWQIACRIPHKTCPKGFV